MYGHSGFEERLSAAHALPAKPAASSLWEGVSNGDFCVSFKEGMMLRGPECGWLLASACSAVAFHSNFCMHAAAHLDCISQRGACVDMKKARLALQLCVDLHLLLHSASNATQQVAKNWFCL